MDHDDFDQEPIRGLPAMLPEGERILWQGAPSPWALARDGMRLRWVAGYFAVLFAGTAVAGMADAPAASALAASSFYLVAGAAACALLYAVAWAQAKATVYTVTTARVVMRIGAALTVTYQFPFRWIGGADLSLARDGTGTIALSTTGETRFSYLLLWPHARPWRFRSTEPALRCIPDAAAVAGLLAEAVGARPVAPAAAAAPAAPNPAPSGAAVPAE